MRETQVISGSRRHSREVIPWLATVVLVCVGAYFLGRGAEA